MRFNKNIWLSVLVLLLVVRSSFSQNQLAISSYYMNGFNVNPAYSGLGEDLFLSFRASQLMGDESSKGLDYMAFGGYMNLGYGLAAGFRTNYQKLGNIGYTDIDLSMSYRVDFYERSYVAFSASTGVIREKLSLAGNSYSQYVDRNDPLLQGGDVFFDKTRVAIGAGALYKYEALEVGLYFPHLMYGENSLEGYFIATAKCIYNESTAGPVKIGNYAMFRNQADGSNFYDGGLLVGINDIVWVSGAYRSTNEFIGGIYFDMTNIRVGYNLNSNMGEFNDLVSGRHEFTVMLRTDKESKKKAKNRWYKTR